MDGRSLVLGGGGATGNAWQVGVVAGLRAAGVDLTTADLMIGTSAGATTATQLRSGVPVAELYADTVAGADDYAGREPPPLTPAELAARLGEIYHSAGSAAEMRSAAGAFALAMDSAPGMTTVARRRAFVAARLRRETWPDRPTVIVAVTAETGEPRLFDRTGGVPLVDALAASCALPGLAPTQPIDGAHYLDGSIRSNDNADLAAGYARIVVLSPLGGRSRAPSAWGVGLAAQVAALRAAGSLVATVTPDADAVKAFGDNRLDPAGRPRSAAAGFAQGQAEAPRVAAVWV